MTRQAESGKEVIPEGIPDQKRSASGKYAPGIDLKRQSIFTLNTSNKKQKGSLMFGCHNCPHVPRKGSDFSKSPCAKCKTAKDPLPHSQYEDDPATFSAMSVMHPAYLEEEEHTLLEEFKKEIFSALSKSVHLLSDMRLKYPETFKFVDAKMQDPNATYNELALRFSCRKQNVMYHLRKAVELCPELSCALLVDTRFSRGFHAFPHTHSGRKE